MWQLFKLRHGVGLCPRPASFGRSSVHPEACPLYGIRIALARAAVAGFVWMALPGVRRHARHAACASHVAVPASNRSTWSISVGAVARRRRYAASSLAAARAPATSLSAATAFAAAAAAAALC